MCHSERDAGAAHAVNGSSESTPPAIETARLARQSRRSCGGRFPIRGWGSENLQTHGAGGLRRAGSVARSGETCLAGSGHGKSKRREHCARGDRRAVKPAVDDECGDRAADQPGEDLRLADPVIGEEAPGRLRVGPILAGHRKAFSHGATHPLQQLARPLVRAFVRQTAAGKLAIKLCARGRVHQHRSHALNPNSLAAGDIVAGVARRNPVDDTFAYHDHRCMGTTRPGDARHHRRVGHP